MKEELSIDEKRRGYETPKTKLYIRSSDEIDVVYCENCKYLYHRKFYAPYACIREGKVVNDYLDSYLEYPNARYKNRNNDCKYYKRKWWRFWVK